MRHAFALSVCLLGLSLPARALEPLHARNGMVASDHRLASEAGLAILRQGGNAVDAAIATSLALAVVRNQSTGIGGGGFMLIRMADGRTSVIDSREIAPERASQDMFLNSPATLSTTGWLAAGVPGLLAGHQQAARQWGTLPLKQLLAPAIALAEQGFSADAHYAEASQAALKRGADAEFRRVFFCQERPCAVGEKVRLPDLARTLRRLAAQGFDDFYRGQLAAQIASASQQGGGLLSGADLAHYAPRSHQPLRGRYQGLEVLTMPPPSSGGTALLEMLNLLGPTPPSWETTGFGSSAHVHRLAEVMKHAYADRAEYLGDPEFVHVPTAELISPAHAERLRVRLEQAREHTLAREAYGKKGLSFSTSQAPAEDHGTTHFAVVDRHGNLVAATETINTYFGSLSVVPGTGILLNNQMDDFSRSPGVPNAFGLIGNLANAIAPRKKPLSSMTPTLVLRDQKPYLALGASGGPRIISATFQTLLNVVDFKLNIAEAIAAPRVHHQWVPDTLYVEKWMPADVRTALTARGHTLAISPAESTVQGILIDGTDITAASDPRKGGAPAGY